MKQDIEVEAALQIIMEHIGRLPAETVNIMEALGRIAVQSTVANHDLPAEPRASVDGYALGDVSPTANNCLRLIAAMDSSVHLGPAVQSGEAAGVVTGGLLPPGTRAVVMHESTRLEGDVLTLLEEVKPLQNIKQPGEDFRQGEVLLEEGTALDFGHIALLAAFGHHEVLVHRRPRIAILALGNNIIHCSIERQPDEIRDSNTPMLVARIHQAGCELARAELSSGRKEQELIAYLEAVSQQVDLIILTGGTYAEEQGEARQLLKSAGAQLLYWGTNTQPGSHNGFALLGNIPTFALSGNPAACVVGFSLFVLPALRLLQGANPRLPKVRARCTNSFTKPARSRRYVRGRAQYGPDGWTVMVLPGQKPSMIRSLISCNALIDYSPGHLPLQPGSEVDVILID